MSMTVPCGQCIGCRLERSRQWAVRCIHEASMHDNNIFVTLTYSPENLPKDGSLNYDHFQSFLKRLRQWSVRQCPCHLSGSARKDWISSHRVRFYMCGEYGDQNGRPHYHAILFNLDFPDKKPWRRTPTGYMQFRSSALEKLWRLGNCEFGTVTMQSAAYCARYIMKKVNGSQATFHYCDIDPDTGEILAEVKPEFSNMSRKPGIGRGWIEKFQSDVYPHGFVVVNGHKQRPPRYYDAFFKDVDPLEYEMMVFDRSLEIAKKSDDMTPERLSVREHVAQANLQKLVRPLK